MATPFSIKEQKRSAFLLYVYIVCKAFACILKVSAYFKPCYGTVLCNCGMAVRSGDSLFVANFCKTVYKGVQRVNRYMIQRLCDDQSLVIQKTSTSYTVRRYNMIFTINHFVIQFKILLMPS